MTSALAALTDPCGRVLLAGAQDGSLPVGVREAFAQAYLAQISGIAEEEDAANELPCNRTLYAALAHPTLRPAARRILLAQLQETPGSSSPSGQTLNAESVAAAMIPAGPAAEGVQDVPRFSRDYTWGIAIGDKFHGDRARDVDYIICPRRKQGEPVLPMLKHTCRTRRGIGRNKDRAIVYILPVALDHCCTREDVSTWAAATEQSLLWQAKELSDGQLQIAVVAIDTNTYFLKVPMASRVDKETLEQYLVLLTPVAQRATLRQLVPGAKRHMPAGPHLVSEARRVCASPRESEDDQIDSVAETDDESGDRQSPEMV